MRYKYQNKTHFEKNCLKKHSFNQKSINYNSNLKKRNTKSNSLNFQSEFISEKRKKLQDEIQNQKFALLLIKKKSIDHKRIKSNEYLTSL